MSVLVQAGRPYAHTAAAILYNALVVEVWVERVGVPWFGVALHGGTLVACAASRTREDTLRYVIGSLPADAPHRVVEEPTPVASELVSMLAELEEGNEEHKRFELSERYVREPIRSVLRAAASIPVGYVGTYGALARAGGWEARAVGHLMATNPLYPIVPCHRVVGSDLRLVGYTGSRAATALKSKLERLRAERRGYTEPLRLAAAGEMEVLPVEWVLARAVRDGVADGPQGELF